MAAESRGQSACSATGHGPQVAPRGQPAVRTEYEQVVWLNF